LPSVKAAKVPSAEKLDAGKNIVNFRFENFQVRCVDSIRCAELTIIKSPGGTTSFVVFDGGVHDITSWVRKPPELRKDLQNYIAHREAKVSWDSLSPASQDMMRTKIAEGIVKPIAGQGFDKIALYPAHTFIAELRRAIKTNLGDLDLMARGTPPTSPDKVANEAGSPAAGDEVVKTELVVGDDAFADAQERTAVEAAGLLRFDTGAAHASVATVNCVAINLRRTFAGGSSKIVQGFVSCAHVITNPTAMHDLERCGEVTMVGGVRVPVRLAAVHPNFDWTLSHSDCALYTCVGDKALAKVLARRAIDVSPKVPSQGECLSWVAWKEGVDRPLTTKGRMGCYRVKEGDIVTADRAASDGDSGCAVLTRAALLAGIQSAIRTESGPGGGPYLAHVTPAARLCQLGAY